MACQPAVVKTSTWMVSHFWGRLVVCECTIFAWCPSSPYLPKHSSTLIFKHCILCSTFYVMSTCVLYSTAVYYSYLLQTILNYWTFNSRITLFIAWSFIITLFLCDYSEKHFPAVKSYWQECIHAFVKFYNWLKELWKTLKVLLKCRYAWVRYTGHS